MAKKVPTKLSEVILLDDYVLIQYEEVERTEGGIILPAGEARKGIEPFHEGTIVLVGEGRADLVLKVKVGDTALIPANMPRYIFTIEEKTYFLVRQTDILMIKRKK